MLGAILHRLIMPLEAALKEVDELHRRILAQPVLN